MPEMATLLEESLQPLLGRLFWVVATLGTAALAGPLIRSRWYGWSAALTVDAFLYVFILVALSLRRRLGAGRAMAAVLLVVWVDGLASLVSYGVASTGVLILSMTVTFVGIIFGMRWGVWAALLSTLVVGAVGVGRHLGFIPALRHQLSFLEAPETWITHAVTLTLYTVSVLLVVHAVQHRLLRALRETAAQTDALAASERKYRLLAESVSDVVFVQRLDFTLEYVSSSVTPVTGWGVEEVLGMDMRQYLTAESFAQASTDLKRYAQLARETGQDSPPLLRYQFVCKDGHLIWGELRARYLRDEQGRVCALQGALRDITERVERERERAGLEEKLRAAEKMRAVGQLAGGVAHDFNNQLSVILGYADLLRRSPELPPRLRTAAERIATSGASAADLTSKLLALSHPGPAKTSQLDAHGLVDGVMVMLEHGLDKRITLHRRLEASSCGIAGDRGQLETALLNLALNARDAMPGGGQLVVGTRLREATEDGGVPWVEIYVQDTGTGMTEEVRRRALEPFFTTKPLGQGTGLGLSLVYGTAVAHGGRVEIDSQPGQGTTVSLLLPLATAARYSVRPPTGSLHSGAGRILLVDDDPSVCAVTRDLLEELGYVVEVHSDPAKALQRAVAAPGDFDLVLTDLTMPGLDGHALCQQLTERAPRIAVVVYTGRCDEQEESRLRAEGARAVIHKPFSFVELSKTLQGLLQPGGDEARGTER